VRHFKDPRFRPLYDALPTRVRSLADKNFALLKQDPKHPSLHFKRIKDDLGPSGLGEITEHWPSRARMASSGSGSAATPTTTGWWVDELKRA
jgi:hypothetical protein